MGRGMTEACTVVVNTYNRAASLRNALSSLRRLRHAETEIIVVNGPSTDDTEAVVSEFADCVRYARCPVRNLSTSRNIGISLAQGDFIYFIDDDAVAEPNWIEEMLPAFADPRVAAANGWVRDATGVTYQFLFSAVDTSGMDHHGREPSPAHIEQRWGASQIPSVIGVNCAFRRSAIEEVGGFDENYEYFLDETDVCARLIRAGYRIATRPSAEVHHKFSGSHLRRNDGVTKSIYQPARSGAYFTTRVNFDDASLYQSLRRCAALRGRLRGDVGRLKRDGKIDQEGFVRLSAEIDAAIQDGVRLAFEWPNGRLSKFPQRPRAVGKRARDIAMRIAVVSQDYPPAELGGIGVAMHVLAEGLAARGHEVSVVTRSPNQSHTVDFENDVWVHRVPDAAFPWAPAEFPPLPNPIRARATAVAAEIARIRQVRGIDVVISAIWDLEGIYCHLFTDLPHIVCLVTTYQLALPFKPDWIQRADYRVGHVEPVIRGEQWLLRRCDGIFASTHAIAREIEQAYQVPIADKLHLVPFGVATRPASLPKQKQADQLGLLFVGRLEQRKGIDTLFDALEQIMPGLPTLHVRIAGNDRIRFDERGTFKDIARQCHGDKSWLGRVEFLGYVDDDRLAEEYASCDIFVAPSTYESFGIIFIEAMSFGKPVIGCSSGGMPEIIVDGVTGILVPPSDSVELARAIQRLASDAALRIQMGRAGLARFSECYTIAHYVDRAEEKIGQLVKRKDVAGHAGPSGDRSLSR
jgi:glycogen synthase